MACIRSLRRRTWQLWQGHAALRRGISSIWRAMDKIQGNPPGRVICEHGIISPSSTSRTRAHSGQELRFTHATAQDGDRGRLIVADYGGVARSPGAGLRDLGNILRLRVVTMEPSRVSST